MGPMTDLPSIEARLEADGGVSNQEGRILLRQPDLSAIDVTGWKWRDIVKIAETGAVLEMSGDWSFLGTVQTEQDPA